MVASDGRWLQVNDKLEAILGRGSDELAQMSLLDVTVEADRRAVDDALGQLGRREIVRWESEVQQARPDGSLSPIALAMAAISDHGAGTPLLLVQETDISGRKRLDAMRDAVVGVRQVIVSASSWEQAAPIVLGNLGTHLDWDLAQYWGADGERRLSLQGSWHSQGAKIDLDDPVRNLSIQAGGGLVGRVWQSGVAAVADDLAVSDYDQAGAERSAGLRSAVAFRSSAVD